MDTSKSQTLKWHSNYSNAINVWYHNAIKYHYIKKHEPSIDLTNALINMNSSNVNESSLKSLNLESYPKFNLQTKIYL